MKKHILDFTVKHNHSISSNSSCLILSTKNQLPKIHPGQFVQLRIDNSPETFLRRPISVFFVDYEANELWLLIQKVGKGTIKLCSLKIGDILNIILPLGKGFTFPENIKDNILLIGGGVGVAPLLYFGAELQKKGFKCNFLLGAKNLDSLLMIDEFRKYGEVYVTTEDGSYGERGFVTQHSVLQQQNFDRIYTCGPTPMMKAVADFAQKNKIFCEVSLENTMACGIGACLCCVTETNDGNVCVCTEGPVFNIEKFPAVK
jgi:2-polyprenylphenol hydroxylase and related flavodoxin oxidoreductases